MGGEGDAEPEEASSCGHTVPGTSVDQEQRSCDGLLGEEWLASSAVEGRAARTEEDEGTGRFRFCDAC